MLATTHAAFASTLYLSGATLFGYQTEPIGWGLAALTSLGPDIDLPTSRLGRAIYWVSTRLERNFGHRTVTHSFIGMAAFAVLASPMLLLDNIWYWCVIGGWWSHIWIDMLNVRGVDLTWPSPLRWVTPGNRNWRMEVGSKAEMILFSVLVILTLALYPLSELGFRGGLQVLIANFDIARDEFIKGAGTRWYRLELTSTDNLTLEQIKCECPVLGIWQNGLIVMYDGKPRAVGDSQIYHNLYPTKARLIEGEELRVISSRVDMKSRSLSWVLKQIDTKRSYFISGQMQVGEKVIEVSNLNLYSPVAFQGNILRLHYAREEEIRSYLGLTATQGEIFVQYWLKPGDPPVDIAIEEQAPPEVIPKALQKYL